MNQKIPKPDSRDTPKAGGNQKGIVNEYFVHSNRQVIGWIHEFFLSKN